MPTNHENITPNQEPIDRPLEQSKNDDPTIRHNKNIGAKILALINFEARHKPIVESSFNKSRKHGEKHPGKNNERRNYAYLSRLEKLIEKHGNKIEKRLWQDSVQDDLLVKEECITEATWEAKKQEHRDNGYGDIELTDELKHEYAEKWRKLQEESLQKWANFLGDERSPYPLWFKVYAWDGMTKMGVYNKTKREYEKRNETTVAPYPEPDAEILSKMFELINRYHGNNEREFYTEDGEQNINLERIIQSGNFSKIYNAVQQEISPIIEPPEKAEDIHGTWIEYGPGYEDYIAIAAKGTGWCVASSVVGKHYLKYGACGIADNKDDYYGSKLKSKFILFHLEDPSTKKISKNAVASIRLNLDGKVAEISGIKDGQALNDSLIQIVEEKVKSLPGGEKFLPKFADKKRIINLDKKMKNGEDLTKEELEFIYEIHRPINTLDTYNSTDPRIKELRDKYNIEYAKNLGIEQNSLISNLSPDYIYENLDNLIKHGANIDDLVSKLGPDYIAYSLNTLIKHGAKIEDLIEHGAKIENLVSILGPDEVAYNLDTLIEHGAKIDDLVSNLWSDYIYKNLDKLIKYGAKIDDLVLILGPDEVSYKLDTLIEHGAKIDINDLVSKLEPYSIIDNLDNLIKHGANIDGLVSKLGPDYIAYSLNALIKHGAKIEDLIEHGAKIDDLVSILGPDEVSYKLDTLIEHGAKIDINDLVSKLEPYSIIDNLDNLIEHGAKIDINDLVSKLEPYYIAYSLDTLIEHGANIDINDLVSKLGPNDIAYNLDTLIKHGAKIDISKYK